MLIYVPLSQIDDNPYQSRTEYGDIAGLAADIAARMDTYPETRGLMQVPRGRLMYDGQPHPAHNLAEVLTRIQKTSWPDKSLMRVQLAFGHRRKRAFDYLAANGLGTLSATHLPVYIEFLSEAEMLDAVWSENYQRADISAVEQAELLQKKLEQVKANGGGQAAVAEAWGLARPTITNRLRLLELPEAIQQANRQGILSERQCLALSTVARIGQMVNGRTIKWGDNIDGSWGYPMSPQEFLAVVIENGDKITSDRIREYQKNLLQHAGQIVPDVVATTPIEDGNNVVQQTCKGCWWRVNQHCLHETCLVVKKPHVGHQLAKAAADKLGLPFSRGDTKHFEPFSDYTKADELRRLYEAGVTGNMVVGWWPAGEAARPYGRIWADNDPFATATGVAIGHKLGRITDEERAQLVTKNPQSKQEVRRERWQEAQKKYTRARVKRTKAAVSAVLQPLFEVEPEVLRPLLAIAKPETLKNTTPDQYVKVAMEWIWSKAYYIGESRSSQRKFLERVGLSADLMEPEDAAERLIDMATEALLEWYRSRTWSYGDSREKAAALVAEAREAFGSASPALFNESDELVELFAALDEAAEDVDRVMAAEEEE